MRYQVGRACAAAGYVDLYQELSLLPDVFMAEEAHESGTEGGLHNLQDNHGDTLKICGHE